MSDTSTASPVRLDGPVSIARLHCRARWGCGAVAKDLTPARTVKFGENGREWAIVTCGCQTTAVA
ncbi:hypothetical protein ACWCPI_00710 [Streptomyces sp. NPDC001920]